ncbi:tRNA pseudouridine13 synthase [Nematocida major]|uniref:tRNA pseudouridine13 synthase n=1 Tax=Nematocida major TaxID=1912982 RepID=UPI0020083278|nr:tRNA pseudouridine13 synthase [Nematocida major]KAH9387268.1 tRNA pseudouridine13 synthase [Nematocida major]
MLEWKKCLNEGNPVRVILKKEESDFIVRERAEAGLLSAYDTLQMPNLILDGLPGIRAKLLQHVDALEEASAYALYRVTGIRSKEERRKIHQMYSMHPFIYTVSVKNDDIEGSEDSDVLIVFDTHHKNHIYAATVTKRGKNTNDIIDIVSSMLKIKPHKVSFSGNKDKKAITTQRISIEGCCYIDIRKAAQNLKSRDPEFKLSKVLYSQESMGISDVLRNGARQVLGSALHKIDVPIVLASEIIPELDRVASEIEAAKAPEQADEEYIRVVTGFEQSVVLDQIERIDSSLGLGQLSGNRFYLNLEVTEGLEFASERATKIAHNGFPNYYGSQRFGVGMDNPAIGEALTRRDNESAVSRILGSLKTLEHSQNALKAHELIQEKKYKEAEMALPRMFRNERKILNGLSRGMSPAQAFKGVDRPSRLIYVHSYQSMIFNDDLQRRLINGLKEKEYATDRNISSVTSKKEIESETYITEAARWENLMIPLWPYPEAQDEGKEAGSHGGILKGGLRKAVIKPENMAHKVSGSLLQLSFTLPPGVYATTLVKELSQNEVSVVTW